MEIPGSGIINRYIATQGLLFLYQSLYFSILYFIFYYPTGPLQTTIGDFWQMVLESRSSLIIMVTALVEKGRQKCAKYWPPVNESLEVNSKITIKTVSEETDTSNIIVYRQVELTELSVSILIKSTSLIYN